MENFIISMKLMINITIILWIIFLITKENNFKNNLKGIFDFLMLKYKYKSSHKKLAIVLPVNFELHQKHLIYNTLRSIFYLNHNYSLYLIYNKECPKIKEKKNIFFIKALFSNVFTAYNFILDSISDDYDYITFLTPGDYLIPSTYDFLDYIEEHDIYQIYHFKEILLSKKIYNNQTYNFSYIEIYDFVNNMPNNIHVIYDKIYKVSLLKGKNIKFIVSQKSQYYFNLLAFSFSKDLLSINLYGITHNVKITSSKLYDNKNQEKFIFKRIIAANKRIPKKIIEDMNKIDFVFPYVKSDDPYWMHLYNISLTRKESEWEAGLSRYRDNGLLKYLFRSLDQYLPWINKVHMIVMSDSQVPDWINREKVHIIYHSDFIPKKYLPTFSSTLIEMFLPFLPLVEENFIYGNDDLIAFRYLSKDLFFDGNIPRYSINIRDYLDTAPGDKIRRNIYNLIMGKTQDKRVVTTQHATISYKMSLIKKCFKKYEKEIFNSLSNFREDKNLNQYIYAFYQMMEDTIINTELKVDIYYVKPYKIRRIMNDNFSNYDFVCLNDEDQTTEKDWKKILSKIKRLLPKKSKYEK